MTGSATTHGRAEHRSQIPDQLSGRAKSEASVYLAFDNLGASFFENRFSRWTREGNSQKKLPRMHAVHPGQTFNKARTGEKNTRYATQTHPLLADLVIDRNLGAFMAKICSFCEPLTFDLAGQKFPFEINLSHCKLNKIFGIPAQIFLEFLFKFVTFLRASHRPPKTCRMLCG